MPNEFDGMDSTTPRREGVEASVSRQAQDNHEEMQGKDIAPGANGQTGETGDIRPIAKQLVTQGFAVVRVQRRAKRAIEDEWQKRSPTPEEIDDWNSDDNVGIRWGQASGDRAEIDLESPAAARAAAALPLATGMRYGRASNPQAHRVYVCAGVRSRKFSAPRGSEIDGKAMIVELRAEGSYTVAPGSVHPSGERYEWFSQDEPAVIDEVDLMDGVTLIALATLVGSHWALGIRHDASLAIAGWLRRRGYSKAKCKWLLVAIAAVAGDDEMRDRIATIESTFDKPLDGKTTGLPTLIQLLAPPNADAFATTIDGWVRDTADRADEGEEDDEFALSPPAPLRREAYLGLAGDLVRFVCGEDGTLSEASPVAMLTQFLVAFGCAVGERARIRILADDHFSNEFELIIGATAHARKGMTARPVHKLMAEADPNAGTARAFEKRIYSSVGSGQGVVHAIRDRREETKFITDEKTGKTHTKQVIVDHGVIDKRLLIAAGEFQSVLAAAVRPESTVTAVLRDCWDHRALGALTKNEGKGADQCERPHVSFIGHMTRMELLEKIKSTDETNGFLNRFIIIFQPLPKVRHALGGTRCEGPEWKALRDRLRGALTYWWSRDDGREARLAPDAEREWVERIYLKLCNPRVSERVAAVIARADAHCLRLALIFAMIEEGEVTDDPFAPDGDARHDGRGGVMQIELRHLLAAEAIIDYANESAAYVFGDQLMQQVRKLAGVIRQHGQSAPWKEVRVAMGMRVEAFDSLIAHLDALHFVRIVKVATKRRPRRQIELLAGAGNAP